MLTVTELIARYKNGSISFDAMLDEVPNLQWAPKHVEPDGEIWWGDGSTVGDVEILWYEDIITDDERAAIFSRVP